MREKGHACDPGVEEADDLCNLLLEVVCIGHLGVLPVAVADYGVVVEELLGHLASLVILLQLLCSLIALQSPAALLHTLICEHFYIMHFPKSVTDLLR